MAVKTQQLPRVFKYKGKDLKDPNPMMTLEDVLDYYSDEHPELINAKPSPPKIVGDSVVYEIESSFKQKG
jgi:PRTRC genetic system protein C